MLHTIGQIGLHLFTETVASTLAKGGVSLVKIGDLCLVKLDNVTIALPSHPPAHTHPPEHSGAPLPPSQATSPAINETGLFSVDQNESGSSSSHTEKPPFRTGLAVVLDGNHQLRAKFRTLISPSVRLVVEPATADFVAFEAFDHDGIDVRVRLENSRPVALQHFRTRLDEALVDDRARVTDHTQLSVTEINPNTLLCIDDRLPVVIAPLASFPGRIWHLLQVHPARDAKHYVLLLLR